jgi:hypothetical protein
MLEDKEIIYVNTTRLGKWAKESIIKKTKKMKQRERERKRKLESSKR